MSSHVVDDIEILLWSTPMGLSAFAAPWAFDLEYDAAGRATIDASSTSLREGPPFVDRYRVLNGAERARVLKAALARRDDYRDRSRSVFEGYLVRMRQPGIDEDAFLRIVGAFMVAWRRRQDEAR